MNNDHSPKYKPWLERLSDAFLREPHNREELIQILHDAKDHEIIDNDALKMIERVLQVTEMQVRDAMIPRSHMITVAENFTTKEALPQIIDSGHSRYPVVAENSDKILGFLLAKDLLKYILTNHADEIQIKQLIRPAVFIPESKRLNVLLREFRLNRTHIAIVVDEYGATSGLITIEDVLEEIVGEIEDEYDITEEPNIRRVDINEFIVNALTPVGEFNDYFMTHFSDEDVDTISGLILQKLSHLPEQGEQIQLGSFLFTVMSATNRGISTLKVIPLPQESKENEEE